MKAYIVVLNWNGKNFVEECLDSLLAQSYPAEIIVIDNGSTDGSKELIEDKYAKKIHLIKEGTNHGFAGGVNIGIKHAMKNKADVVALFNNDAVADKNWLRYLIESMQKDMNLGIVTCKLMRSDKKHLDSTGDFYSIWGMPFPRGRNQKDIGQFDNDEKVFGASGGASLYRTKTLKKVDLFDERFFAYFEDVDISFRVRLAGWNILYQPEAMAYHKVSATSSKMAKSFTRYHSIKNFLMLYTKNMPVKLYWKYLPLFILQMLRLAASSLIRGGFFAYLKGLGMFLLYLPGVLVSRWRIQRSSKLMTSEVNELLYHARPPRIPILK